jgi:antitoxin (DNA-binding transcriptional repressor) of toxin-antitoxin stability system
MKNISLAEARANIAELLQTVERGEAVTIQPDVPMPEETEAERLARTRRAVEDMLELRKHNKPASVEEIIAWKNEGRM